MLPNCEHEDCCEVLELAEVCSGLRFNNMVMLAQIAKNKFRGSRSWAWSRTESKSISGSKPGSKYWSVSSSRSGFALFSKSQTRNGSGSRSWSKSKVDSF